MSRERVISSSSAPLATPPLAIPFPSLSRSSSSLPDSLQSLCSQRLLVDAALNSPSLATELADGTVGPHINQVRRQLEEIIQQASVWKTKVVGRKISSEEEARGTFVHAWAVGRAGEFDGTTQEALPLRLKASLALYEQAGTLLKLPLPPALDSAPSVTRPSQKTLALILPEQPAWVGEFLAEWARTQTTLAFSKLLIKDEVIEEEELADLLEMSCRRNVAALFTPLEPPQDGDDPNPSETSTVLGNARLIKDMATMFPFTHSPELWLRRIQWATHCADALFVESSMSANRLVDAASASASILQKPTSQGKRTEVRSVLEATIRRLVPFEKAQGSCLLGLGQVMLEAIGALYLGKGEKELATKRRRDDSRDSHAESENEVEVPENELVRETRQVLIRAAGLFENAYASFQRTPAASRSSREEQRILTRLETSYCALGELDNDTPEVVQLRAERVARALWINDRLIELGDDEGDNDSEDEDVDTDSGDEDIVKRSMSLKLV